MELRKSFPILVFAILFGLQVLNAQENLLEKVLSQGTPSATDEQIDTLKAKAEQGDAEAQFNLGFRYDFGAGVPEDKEEALKWYQMAAEQGLPRAQNALSKLRAEVGKIKKKTITVNGVSYTFCWCPPGEFTMGSPKSEEGHFAGEKQHRVKLTKGFWLLESEVTQEMWETVMGTTVVEQHDMADRNGEFIGIGPLYPMYYVNWDECQDFCLKLSELSGKQITLPTEAQWEYACRAGTDGPYGRTGRLDSMGWYGDNSCSLGPMLTMYVGIERKTIAEAHEVKMKLPNHWGLYDMHGSVWEWCSDWKGVYSDSPQVDPKGPESGTRRVRRGGSLINGEQYCRSAYRYSDFPTYRANNLGFRTVLIPQNDVTDKVELQSVGSLPPEVDLSTEADRIPLQSAGSLPPEVDLSAEADRIPLQRTGSLPPEVDLSAETDRIPLQRARSLPPESEFSLESGEFKPAEDQTDSSVEEK